MTDTPDISPATRVDEWVENMQHTVDSEIGALLADTFQFFLDHVDAYENGDLSIDDLPALPETEKIYVWASVAFGTRLAADGTTLYVVTRSDDTFVGVYGIEANATRRVADDPALDMHHEPLQGSDPEAYVDWAQSRDEQPIQRLGNALAYMYTHRDAVLAGDVTTDDLPHPIDAGNDIILFSVLFGILWEFSYPSIYGVFTADNVLDGLYANEPRADDAAQDDMYVQRLSVADGDLGPDAILDQTTSHP